MGGHRVTTPGVLTDQVTTENLAVYTDRVAAPVMAGHRAAAPMMGGHRGIENTYTNTHNNWSFNFAELQAVAVPGIAPQICGYFTATGSAFAVAMVTEKLGGGRGDMLKTVVVKPMPLMHWSAIAGLRNFR